MEKKCLFFQFRPSSEFEFKLSMTDPPERRIFILDSVDATKKLVYYNLKAKL